MGNCAADNVSSDNGYDEYEILFKLPKVTVKVKSICVCEIKLPQIAQSECCKVPSDADMCVPTHTLRVTSGCFWI